MSPQKARQIHVEVSEEFLKEFEAACARLHFVSKSETLRWLMRDLISMAKEKEPEK